MSDRARTPDPGRMLVLTPTGRDAEAAVRVMSAEQIESVVHPTLDSLCGALDETVGLVLVADEALFRADLTRIKRYLTTQPPWSDLPFIVLTQAGVVGRRQTTEMNLSGELGNVLFMERPLNALSLVSAVKTALRARRRQWQVRDYLEEQVGAAERANALLEARVRERTEALEAAEEERRQVAAALAQSQKMEAVGQLTGGLAHDFNNMLAVIMGSLELLEKRLGQGRVAQLGQYIGMARLGAERAAALTHRLLAFSRRQTLDPKPTPANRLVSGMLSLIRSTIGPQIAMSVVLDDDLWPTLCDPHQLENALLNLCINARDAMPDGGELTIDTCNRQIDSAEASTLREARAGDYVALSVSDTGVGMSPEVIARAFDPFFTTKPLGYGTGLGLSMIYGFVQQSGGHVQISSKIGQGTKVELYLPRHNGEPAEAGEPARAGALGVSERRTILVVDDEPIVRVLMTEALTDSGYEIFEAADGPSALQLLRSKPQTDLLVTDVGMPGGMNGRQLADVALTERPDLKILLVTGYAEAALTGDCQPGVGMQVMAKPFVMADLTAKIRTMLP